jgi:hypothetical protein
VNAQIQSRHLHNADDLIEQALDALDEKSSAPAATPTKDIEELFAPLRGLNLDSAVIRTPSARLTVKVYLPDIDTNRYERPSEFSRGRPEPRVVKWVKAQPVTTLFLSAITIGEIRKGLVVTPQGAAAPIWRRGFGPTCLYGFVTASCRVTHGIADRWGEQDGQCQLK